MLNWTRRVMADGVVFYPPEGRGNAGALRLREYIRPLRRLRDIRADQVRRLAHLGTVTLGGAKAMDHCESEHAVMYKIDVVGASRLEVYVGVVFGDDGYMLVEGMCGEPGLSATFESVATRLTTDLPLGLGSDRRRRYRYKAPPGWQAVVKRHSVTWYPSEYPKFKAAIHVFDAKPAVANRPNNLERLVIMEPQSILQSFTDNAMYSVLTDTGLRGAYEVLRGTVDGGVPAALVRTTLVDTRFSYSLRLEASDPVIDAARDIFDGVVRSVHPVPQPAKQTTEATIQWIE